MKILFLTPQFPYPLDNGGKIGALNGIEPLSKYNNLTVLSFSENASDAAGLAFYAKKIPEVNFEEPIKHKVHIRQDILQMSKVMIKDLILGHPYMMEKFQNKEMYKKIDRILKNEKFDLIWIDYLNMAPYGAYIKKHHRKSYKHIVFKNHNIEYQLFLQESNKRKGIIKKIIAREAQILKQKEMEYIQDAEIVFTVCQNDTDYFLDYQKNTYTMLPTYDIKPYRALLTDTPAVLYIGNLSWKPNVDGMKWFLDKVWPIVKEKCPEASLDIIGSGADISEFSDYSQVNYKGYVEDISGIYSEYRVFIVPLFEGSGIRIKILEAFNEDIAVVATTRSCKTIGHLNNELCMEDDENRFADAVLKLLSDNEFNNKVRHRAKQFMQNYFSLESRQKEIQKILEDRFNDRK